MPDQPPTSPKPPWRLPISAYLGFGLGGMVLLALALLLWVTLGTVFKNTTELLQDKSRIILQALTAQTGRHLDATVAPSAVIADQIATGEIDTRKADELSTLLRTLLAASTQIDVLAFFDVNGTRVVAYREQGQVLSNRKTWSGQADIGAAMDDVRNRKSSIWGPPVYDDDVGTFLNFRQPVFEGDSFKGMVTALVTVRSLSEFLGNLETETGQNAFILYDRDYVLAHLALASSFDDLSPDRPLPKVTEVGDPVLFNIWQDGWQDNRLIAGSGHAYQMGDREYVFLYAPLDDYADAPWLVGSYFTLDEIGTQFTRMIAAAVTAVALAGLTMVGMFLFGRFLGRPINQLAEAATAIRKLDLDEVPALERSRFAELDDAGQAFNAMVLALRAFSRYVPRDLVTRLMTRGDLDKLDSEAKTITVLMTDIVGFTSLAETLSAAETADFLNHHLGLVTRAIEAEGGIVDKYIGDAVMALFGAIDDQHDHADRAIAAAIRIAAAVRQDNNATGGTVRLRIGIHSGLVVVGNIGTATRMNYTVVGDTVNMAQRLEALGKSLLPEHGVAILMSAETAKTAATERTVASLGHHALRGRAKEIEIFTLPDDQ